MNGYYTLNFISSVNILKDTPWNYYRKALKKGYNTLSVEKNHFFEGNPNECHPIVSMNILLWRSLYHVDEIEAMTKIFLPFSIQYDQ